MHLFDTPVYSPLLITLTLIYGMCAAITIYEDCIIQAKHVGYLSNNKAYVPAWTGLFAIIQWATLTAIFLLNWQYELVLFVIMFALKELSILKYLGAWLLRPILDDETVCAVNTTVMAADEMKAMNLEWRNAIKAMNLEWKNKLATAADSPLAHLKIK